MVRQFDCDDGLSPPVPPLKGRELDSAPPQGKGYDGGTANLLAQMGGARVLVSDSENEGLGWDRGISKLERLADVHQGAYLYVAVAVGLSLMAVVGSVWLIFTGQLSTGTALAIATAAFVTYAYNAHFNRRSQIEQMTRQVMALFRDRRDVLAGDPDLLSILTGEVPDLTPIQIMKLECYLYSLFDAYLYAIYLVRWGYLDDRVDLYLMFRNMLSKSVALPHVIDVWNCQRNGKQYFQDEYPAYFVSMVDEVVQDVLQHAQSRSSV